MPPQHTTRSIADAFLGESIDDGARAEGGRLDQRAIDVRARRVQASVRRSARSGGDRRGSCGCRCSSRVRRGRIRPGASRAAAADSSSCRAARPSQTTSTHQRSRSPTADWPASIPRYPGMTEPLTMPQMPGTSGTAAPARRDGDVTGRRADDLDERAGPDAGADGAVVRVEPAHRDGDARAKSEDARPFAGQISGRAIGGPGLVVQAGSQSRKLRIQARQELLRRQAAPRLRVHRLVPGRADAAADLARIGHAREHRWNVVGKLDPACGGIEDVRRDFQAVPDLRPEPFR